MHIKVKPRLGKGTEKLLEKLHNFERDANPRSSPSVFENGFGSMHNRTIYEAIKYGLNHFDISKSKSFLDLGSGLGSKVIIANHIGMPAYGIEINDILHHSSKVIRGRVKKSISRKPCELIHGSYFPNNYVILRDFNASVAQEFEGDEPPSRQEFVPKGNPNDIYDANDIDLSKVGIFYRYGWGADIPSTMEMFSLFGAEDSLLISSSSHYPDRLPELLDRLNLKVHGDYTGLFFYITKT